MVRAGIPPLQRSSPRIQEKASFDFPDRPNGIHSNVRPAQGECVSQKASLAGSLAVAETFPKTGRTVISKETPRGGIVIFMKVQ